MRLATEQTLTDAGLTSWTMLPAGTRVGRYEIVEVLGSGGMGTVYAATDPQLGRRIAIKLLHRGVPRPGSQGDNARRLLREAQAMARFSHPHVITVHDVGTHDGRVFLAMDLVTGPTLQTWMEGRPWAEVLTAFEQAGRGLAAVHAAGFVHRDFKPSNVMVHADGRVVVMDFGLAQPQKPSPEAESPGTRSGPSAPTQDDELSRGGSVEGTPAYMAPEQHLGFDVDARADQFSYCVALFQGLYGTRPFHARTVTELLMRISNHEVVEVESSDVPARLRRVLLRGLREQVRERWPSMTALLEQLATPSRRPRWAMWGIAATAVLGLSYAARPDDEGCDAAAAVARQHWNPSTRSELEHALTRSGRAFAADTARRVDAQLDTYVEQLADAHRVACQDPAEARLLDRRTACLRQRVGAFEATLEVLGGPSDDVANRAMQVVGAMPPIEACMGDEPPALAAETPDDDARRQRVDRVRKALSKVAALQQAGEVDEALSNATEALALARACEFRPVEAEALRILGSAQEAAAQYESAANSLEEAYHMARACHSDQTAARAAADLVYTVGYRLRQQERGDAWARHAQAELDRTAADSPGRRSLEARITNNRATLEYNQGNYLAAMNSFARVVTLHTQTHGEEHPDTAAAHSNLGLVLSKLDRADEALEHHRVARASWEASLGAHHPMVAVSANNSAVVLEQLERFDEAATAYQRAIEIRTQSLGGQHPGVALSTNNLGHVRMAQGRAQEALELHQSALAIWHDIYGPEHPRIGRALEGIAIAMQALHRFDEARSFARRNLDTLESTVGRDHVDYTLGLETLARIEFDRGHLDAGIEALRAALDIAIQLRGESSELATRFSKQLAAAPVAPRRAPSAQG